MKVVVFDKETGEKSPEVDVIGTKFKLTPDNAFWLLLSEKFPERYELRPVLEGVEVFVARERDGELLAGKIKPELVKTGHYYFSGTMAIQLDKGLFQSIQPGQCVKAKIVLDNQ